MKERRPAENTLRSRVKEIGRGTMLTSDQIILSARREKGLPSSTTQTTPRQLLPIQGMCEGSSLEHFDMVYDGMPSEKMEVGG